MHFPVIRLLVAAAILVPPLSGFAQSITTLIEKGDTFDRKFQAEEALKCYLPAEVIEPLNVDVLLRIARQYRHLMADATLRDEKLRLGNLSLEYAKRASAFAPSNSEAQLSPAITYGKMMAFVGTKQQVEATPLIKAGAERAIQLDPKNDLAWYVLGRWHEVLADVGMLKHVLGQLIYGKLPTGSNETAVMCFNKAISINGRSLRNYVELGRTYAQMGRSAEARRLIEKGLAMPNREKDDSEVKARGRETLAILP